MRHVWVALSVFAVVLAGCAEEGTPEPEDDFSSELDQELQATDETGVIRGVVVDNSITPVEGATIRLSTGDEATSNADGAFGFGGLEPGTYFLDITKIGFLSVQQSAEVVAGEDRPPVVRVLLERDATFNPYSSTIQHTGFYQCGTSVVVVCGAPNILLGGGTTADTSTMTFYWEAQPDFVQTEMVWESTQALSTQLYFEMEALDETCDGDTFLTSARGDSPIRARANATVLEESTIGGDCGIYHSVFAGDATGGAAPVGVGFSVEQQFDWFITAFYGYAPPEDWWYVNDGPLPPPS